MSVCVSICGMAIVISKQCVRNKQKHSAVTKELSSLVHCMHRPDFAILFIDTDSIN